MKLVKEISTNNYQLIDDTTYSANTELYIDRSANPTYWYNNYEKIGISYFKMRNYVVEQYELTSGFTSYRDAEKDILGIMNIPNGNELVPFYMGYYGYDLNTASLYHLERVSLNVVNRAIGTRLIARSPKIISVGSKYLVWINPDGSLNSLQANNFTAAIANFMSAYREYGFLGNNYGDDADGIMDYLESTGNYSSGGLKNYVFNPDFVAAYGGNEDLVRLAMVAELKDIFVNGNI